MSKSSERIDKIVKLLREKKCTKKQLMLESGLGASALYKIMKNRLPADVVLNSQKEGTEKLFFITDKIAPVTGA